MSMWMLRRRCMGESMITADKFRVAWCATWAEKDKEQALSDRFSGDGKWSDWTNIMVGSEEEKGRIEDSKAFLCTVMRKLSSNMYYWREELFRADVGFVSKSDAFMNSYGEHTMPLFIDVLIEHENRYKEIHQEMWKLIFYRSPLKVLITYAYGEEAQNTVNKMLEFLGKANAKFRENENTEYLFVIGSVAGKDAKMKWRYASDKEQTLQELC